MIERDVTEHRLAKSEADLHVRRLEAIRSTTIDLARELPLDILLIRIVQCSVALTGGTSGTIYLLNKVDQRLVRSVRFGSQDRLGALYISLGEGVTGTVAQNQQGMFVHHYQKSPYVKLGAVVPFSPVAMLAEPLLYRDCLIGVLTIANAEDVQAFSVEDQNLITLFAAQAAIAIERARLLARTLLHTRALEQQAEAHSAAPLIESQELETFAYSVAHGLRAPLRSISGFAQIIERRYRQALPAEGQHYFDNIISSSSFMGQIIDDLLAYCRTGHRELRCQSISLHDVLPAVVETVAPRLAESDARLTLPEELPVVPGNVTLWHQILLNLLDNALTYHQPDLPLQVTIQCQVETDAVVIRVSDNGIGIDVAYHNKIFNVFQRLHSQEIYLGTGIGLAIVRKAVNALDGQVWVTSAEGAGSTFYVRVPKVT